LGYNNTRKTMNNLKILLIALSGFLLMMSCGSKNGKTGKLNDGEGNTYSTVTIGTQEWMTENLRATKYNDGSAILNVTADSAWAVTKEGAYAWFINDASGDKASYGAYYNWHAIASGKLCPAGWHVPADKEWRTLTTYLGGESLAGNEMKSGSGWKSNGNGSNSSGFNAIPYGYRTTKGIFSSQGASSYFWSSTENGLNAWYIVLFSKDGTAFKYFGSQQSGFSVRCIRDAK
jgi:uncharacterized protein (TIGR02145 family)